MIEETVRNYLLRTFSTVLLEQPAKKPASYIVLQKTGSGESNHIYSATIAIQSYGDNLYDAATLNERVKSAMENITSLNEICKVSLNSDYNFTDTTTKQYRYQAVFDIKHY
mgnify:CR=1 FL=1